MPSHRRTEAHSDTPVILRESASRLDPPIRRLFLKQAVGLGTLTLLAGCDVVDDVSAERALGRMSDFNDRVQAWLFNPRRLAHEYPESAISRPFPFNAFYPEGQSPEVDPESYVLDIVGLVDDQTPWTLGRLYALPRVTQVTRHICIEGWSAIGKWSGVRFSEFLARIGADTSARYVTFRCEDGYTTSLDMATALHPQTQLTFWFDDAVLPAKYGFPMKLRVPTKLGFKNPKHIAEIEIGNEYTGGY
jgi:DMSO/TMAO reductase YedYZ molybdopterin-dependent catalytic subunit